MSLKMKGIDQDRAMKAVKDAIADELGILAIDVDENCPICKGYGICVDDADALLKEIHRKLNLQYNWNEFSDYNEFTVFSPLELILSLTTRKRIEKHLTANVIAELLNIKVNK